ncbi:MAG TPA: hypothetical protein VN851_28065 [Thermoanaerobaculia bacterium]|nr:hypothetical protein [Thermoanaerobaculia bacterium]
MIIRGQEEPQRLARAIFDDESRRPVESGKREREQKVEQKRQEQKGKPAEG